MTWVGADPLAHCDLNICLLCPCWVLGLPFWIGIRDPRRGRGLLTPVRASVYDSASGFRSAAHFPGAANPFDLSSGDLKA